MSKQRILIVDDEEDICMILSYSLQKAGYDTTIAHSAEEALALLSPNSLVTSSPDSPIALILLDIMMDGMSGIDLAQLLKNQSQTATELVDSGASCGNKVADVVAKATPPIIFLTALSDEDTLLQGFQLGADDYITKPFRIAEVLARVAAVLRRSNSQPSITNSLSTNTTNTISFEGIVINKNDMSLTIDGETIKTTRKELELLCYLLTHRGQLLSREHLLNNVWDKNGYVLERTIDVHIRHLRQKLGPYGKHIITKSGYGYLFEN